MAESEQESVASEAAAATLPEKPENAHLETEAPAAETSQTTTEQAPT